MHNRFLMRTMGGLLAGLSLLIYPTTTVRAEVNWSVGIHLGIHIPVYPRLILIPGYPVYYAPHLRLNFFFYDGLYWLYEDDHWYVSGWYNGPWHWVSPAYVPVFVLRIPVRYYLHPPPYFYGWRLNAPPRWSERWGRDWERDRRGWDRWDRRVVPPPAPLPGYQQHYSGPRYPSEFEQQQRIRSENYRFRPRDDTAQRQWQPRGQEEPRGEPSRPPARPDPQWRGPQPPPRALPDRPNRERESVPGNEYRPPATPRQPAQPRTDRQERQDRQMDTPPLRGREPSSRQQPVPQHRPEQGTPGAQPMPPQFTSPTEQTNPRRRARPDEDNGQPRR